MEAGSMTTLTLTYGFPVPSTEEVPVLYCHSSGIVCPARMRLLNGLILGCEP